MKFSKYAVLAFNRVHTFAQNRRFTTKEMRKLCSSQQTEWSRALWACFDKSEDDYCLNNARFNALFRMINSHGQTISKTFSLHPDLF